MIVVYIISGLIVGGLIGFLFVRQQSSGRISTLVTRLENEQSRLSDKEKSVQELNSQLDQSRNQNDQLKTENNQLQVQLNTIRAQYKDIEERFRTIQDELIKKNKEFLETKSELATFKANNDALNDRLSQQKEEIEKLGKKFNTEFENIANKILDEKTAKFTDSNKRNLESILKPLGDNIEKFKAKVQEVYEEEAKQRFSLGEKVKELKELNQTISEEAKNLTNALKGEAKTQGRWGEMILESILEKSGLRKGSEYFLEAELKDDEGKAIRSESEGKKMRPDAIIKYPDNRTVIIDSKVSLNAFTRYLSATDAKEQQLELDAHLSAVKSHIIALSTKGYDDYDKALDFVMMFIPSEPAYIAAMKGDPDLWNFAYDKRVLLLNPTNLITSLKLILDLWKREYQNRHAIEIAERGAKLYDKFVGFTANLEAVGDYIDKAKGKYVEAHKQLTTGNDNLVLQVSKLKKLGLKTKKQIDPNLLSDARRLDEEE